MSNSTELTVIQHELLLAVFHDCREFYPSRQAFDRDHKRLRSATLVDLYKDWKAVNANLASGNPVSSAVLANWPTPNTPESVQAMRQVLGLFSRLEGFSDDSLALEAYSARVSSARGRCPSGLDSHARSLIETWLGPAPVLADLLPKHGPGAVAERLRDARDKAYLTTMYPQLIPFGGKTLLHLNDNHSVHEPYKLTEFKHPTTRVVCVPKDFVKPRVISTEPLTMQFLQQGLCQYMMSVIEARCPYINFRDQSVNALLSKNLANATLDMSNASDTVSRRIVHQLFPPDWVKLLFALRSHFAVLPSGRKVPLRCFAPMGSALCFPVEAIVFTAITVAILIADKGEGYVKANKRSIAVYGDDIIVPRDSGSIVMRGLALCGFQPNSQKCCIDGRFRESCGAEWYDGHDVTVVRPRSLLVMACHNERLAGLTELPMVTHAKALMQRGFLSAAKYLAERCNFPVALGDGPGYAPSILPWPWPGRTRWNPEYQRLEQQALLPVEGARLSDTGTGYAMLFMHLSAGWRSQRVTQPRPKPKLRWVSAAPLRER